MTMAKSSFQRTDEFLSKLNFNDIKSLEFSFTIPEQKGFFYGLYLDLKNIENDDDSWRFANYKLSHLDEVQKFLDMIGVPPLDGRPITEEWKLSNNPMSTSFQLSEAYVKCALKRWDFAVNFNFAMDIS
tara:strand:+ start:121 stop:507 length:387 start_codon:yes stop_codon:yes gene_type:complete